MAKVRIFYASHSSATPAGNSKVWDHNLLLPLKDLGHDVIRFQYDLDAHMRDPWLRRHGRPKLERALLEQLAAADATRKVDLFFSYFDASMVAPAALDQIRSMGMLTVNWYCNRPEVLEL